MSQTFHVAKKHRYTLVKERLDPEDLKYRLLRGAASGPLPKRVDFRSKLPPAYDQGDLGSCTANALVTAVQFLQPTLPGSRLFLYYNERLMDFDVTEDAGSTLSTGVACLAKYGLCQEADWPYVTQHFAMKPSAYAYLAGRKHVFPHHVHVVPTLTEMMACLAAGHPFVVGIQVYSSFENDAVARTGKVPMPNENAEELLGGHAVLCVGYDSTQKVFIMRNSWGPSWGDHGHFYLPFAYLTDAYLASDLWKVIV